MASCATARGMGLIRNMGTLEAAKRQNGSKSFMSGYQKTEAMPKATPRWVMRKAGVAKRKNTTLFTRDEAHTEAQEDASSPN